MEYKNGDVEASFIEEYGLYGLDEDTIKEVIKCPWRMLKEVLDSDSKEEVRFTYFGVFRPIKKKDGKDNA